MNRQRYLAELTRLLSFMTEGDRQALLRRINERFDEAGPEGEATVMAEMGTPVQMAIRISRVYVPSEGGAPAVSAAVEAQLEDAAPETKKPEAPPPGAAAEADEKSAPEPADTDLETDVLPRKGPEAAAAGQAPRLRVRHGGRALATLVMLTVVGGIPLFCILLAFFAAILLPGAVCGISGAAAAYAGVLSVSILADALMLFGAALALLGLCVFLLWLAIWIIAQLARVTGFGIVALYRLTRGKGMVV